MPRDYHVLNGRNCPDIIWARTKADKLFFYHKRKPMEPVASAVKSGGNYKLSRPDRADVRLPSILACQIFLANRL